jgi:hypothetical protein
MMRSVPLRRRTGLPLVSLPVSVQVTLQVAVLVAALALAFGLGSAGTAAAGGLTKGTVKKLATKVVKKQAPSLSVARAATAASADHATEADRVGGATAAQLGVRPLLYTLAAGTFTKSAALDMDVPAGSYLVAFDIAAESGTRLSCAVRITTTNKLAATNNQPQTEPTIPLVSGTGFLTVAPGDHVRLYCDSDVAIIVPDDVPWLVTLTPTASVTPMPLTPAP